MELKVIELAIVLSEDGPHGRVETFDLVALPFIPRKDELILWNSKLYIVTNVMYVFDTNPADYNYDADPNKQSSVAHDICYKVWLKSAI
ncbi:hypothetical protein J2Z22_001909 [Paenibacillus forsythiae]|uniref:Uncharacterized protein n=1 Tax=Paenibacillus forsythiae TaxID=365616 RepID=A0ABU3H6D5_9BACL|nr:hypothetical protein [Paenibacillus forsythiae]MDT3426383.1 hypothetical protein [Paenibacillus forsythiae]